MVCDGGACVRKLQLAVDALCFAWGIERVVGIPLDGFGDASGVGGRSPNLVALVMFHCRSYVEALECVRCP